MIPINLAVEDQISEVIVRKLFFECKQTFAVGQVIGHTGYGYLRSTIGGWNNAAKGMPFFVLTDLDQALCAPSLQADWLRVPKHPNLIFRVAIREVEAWLLGDIEKFSEFLKVPTSAVPIDPEGLADPKYAVVSLARRSRSMDLRRMIAPKTTTTAKQGPEYNQALGRYVRSYWRPRVAALHCPSLDRCLKRLDLFEPEWHSS